MGLKQVRQLVPSVRPVLRPPPKTVDDLYRDPRWLRMMAGIKRVRGDRCQDCGVRGGDGVKVHGDHIVEVKDGGEAYSARNIRLRCTSCHNRKTAQARRMRCEGVGAPKVSAPPCPTTAI